MAGLLSKLFKPKWQNASSAIRLQAVQDLDANSSENQSILKQLLSDEAQSVRLAAIEKTQSTDILLDRFSSASEDDKQALMKRINELATKLGLSLFDLIEDKSMLAEMIVSTGDESNFLSGLARLEDESALLTIAMQAQSTRIRQAASELIESEEPLAALATSAKGRDKRVYQIVKAKLGAIKERQKQHSDTEQQLEALLDALSKHAATDATRQYDAKLKSLQHKWESLKSISAGDTAQKIEDQIKLCSDRAQAIKQAAQQVKDSEQAAQHSGEEQVATLKLLQETQDRLESQPCEYRELPALDGLIKTQETRWIESARDVDVSKQDQKHYQQVMQSLRSFLKAMSSLAARQEELENALSTFESGAGKGDISAKLKQIQHELDWPANYEKPTLLKRLASALGEQHARQKQRKEQKASLVSNFHSIIDRLDKELEEKQFNQSKRLLKEARNTLSQLEPQSRHALQSAINLRSAQLNELKDWQGYASAKRQQELCDSMEKLVDVHMPPREKAQKIKAYQDEWKALGGSDNEELWQRFSKAADDAFEPCAEFFKEQDSLRESNLQKRSTLVEQLSAFVDSNDWSSPDWKAADTINRKARQEWRDAYPIDPRKGKPLQKRFNAVLDTLDNYLRTEKDKNLKIKQRIVEQAEALLENTPLTEAMNRAKELQSEWQQSGITEHKKERALWKKFRAACDAIFAQRDAEREVAKQAQQEKLDAATALCSDIEAAAGNADSSLEALEKLRKEYRQRAKAFSDLSGKPRTVFQDRYSASMKLLENAIKTMQSTSVLSMWREAERKSRLLSEVFASKTDPEASQDAFQGRGDLNLTAGLENQFNQAWEDLRQGNVGIKSEAQVQELCIRCEIAAGQNSPESDQEIRMQLQVSRLSEGLSGNRSQSREEQIQPLLTSWYCDAGISPALRDQFEARIWSSIESLYLPQNGSTTQKTQALEDA